MVYMANAPPKANKAEIKEAKSIIKEVEKKKMKSPNNEEGILNWSMQQLKAYVLKNTSGMNPTKKMKWAMDLDKRIKKLKEERDSKK
jgi:hypothetical protein